jgi:hypothetical protein
MSFCCWGYLVDIISIFVMLLRIYLDFLLSQLAFSDFLSNTDWRFLRQESGGDINKYVFEKGNNNNETVEF